MKLHKGKVAKYVSVTAVILALVHVAARTLAGSTVVSNVHSPSETDTSLFWMGFWQFRYTSDRFPEEWNVLQPMEVIGPHVSIIVAVGIILAIIGSIRYFVKANPNTRSTITLCVSVAALVVSIISFMINVVLIRSF